MKRVIELKQYKSKVNIAYKPVTLTTIGPYSQNKLALPYEV
jgi:hypothetical protein